MKPSIATLFAAALITSIAGSAAAQGRTYFLPGRPASVYE